MNPLLNTFLTIALMSYLAGMVQVWGWVIGQLYRQRAISLPRFDGERRAAPWGLGTMVLVFLLYLGLNIGGIQTYLVVTGQNHRDRPQSSAPIPVEARKVEPAKVAGSEEKSPEPIKPTSKVSGDVKTLRTSLDTPLLSVTEGMFLVTLINEILVVAIPLLVRMTSGARLRDLGWIPSDWGRQFNIGVGGALFAAPIVYTIQLCAVMIWSRNDHPVEDMIRDQFTPPVAYLAVLSAVIMAPIVEELMFRGLIQTWLFQLASRQQERKTPPPEDLFDDVTATDPPAGFDLAETRSRRAAFQAIAMTSFFFALVHSAQWPAPIPIFLLSVGLGIVYHLTGSLLASIAMHATFNSLSTLMLFWSMSMAPQALPIKEPLPRPAMSVPQVEVSSPVRSRISTPRW